MVNDPKKPDYHIFTVRPYAIFEQRSWQPALNLYETEQAVVVVAEVAGVDLDSLQIDVQPNMVIIQGLRRVIPPEHLRRIDRMEITPGPFRINIPLNVPIDPEQTESHYNHGLLQVVLPLARRPAQRVAIQTEGDQP